MKLEIFNVEHGACSLLTCDDGRHIAIDCGHNSTTRWYLHHHLLARGITYLDELWITNLDQDHLSGLVPLRRAMDIGNILINRSLTADDLWCLKYLGGQPTDDITLLCNLMKLGQVNMPWAPLPVGIDVVHAWNIAGHPFWDTNNLSMAAVLSMGGIKILFPGDLEADGMRSMLTNPVFGQKVRGVDLLVAPHHGRENGCCDQLFDLQLFGGPQACIISDGYIQHTSQQTVGWYHSRMSGIVLTDGTKRRVLTTRRDGNITIEVKPARFGYFTVQVGRRSALAQSGFAQAPSALADVFRGGILSGGVGRGALNVR